MAGYSILDVAKKAGVSKSTVSRVLTGGSVSPKTAEAVKAAIQELQYSPNHSAQVLRGAPTYTVGVTIAEHDTLLNRSLTTRLAGMNQVLAQAGYSFLLINIQTTPDRSAETAIRFLQESRVDGLIFLGNIEEESQRRLLLNHREIVYTGERVAPDKGFRVYMGNYYYSYDLYKYLLQNGHSKVLTVYERSNRRLRERRNAAYGQVCKQFYTVASQNNIFDLSELADSQGNPLDLLYQHFVKGSFTAIFADSTELANRIINYFSQYGLLLKQDYSLVAIQRAADSTTEPLMTSVCLPDYEYGLQCARLMLDVLKDPTLQYKDIQIPYEIKIKSSVKNLIK